MTEVVSKVGIEVNGNLIVPAGVYSRIMPVRFVDGSICEKLFIVIDEENKKDLLLIDSSFEYGFGVYGGIYRYCLPTNKCIAISQYDKEFGEKWTLIDINTLLNISGKNMYDSIKSINDDYYLVEKDNLLGIIDFKGQEVLPIKFVKIEVEDKSPHFTAKVWLK